MKYLEVASEDSDGNTTTAYVYMYGKIMSYKWRRSKGSLGAYRTDTSFMLSRRAKWWILSKTMWAPYVLYESFYGMFHHKGEGLERQKYMVE